LPQLVVILLAARLGGALFRRLGQSVVVGEIAAGLILGPSLLGQLDWVHSIFHPQLPGVSAAASDQLFHWIFTVLSQLGLVLLLFLIGLEFEFSHLRQQSRSAFWISTAGILLPFGLGFAIAPLIHGRPSVFAAGELSPPIWTFALFLGTALSITALPILGRLMIELNVHRTRIGGIAISAAAAGDAVGWVLLAAVSALARARFEWSAVVFMLGSAAAFAAFLIFLAGPVLRRFARRSVANGEPLTVNSMATMLVVLLVCAWVTSWIGIFAIFGAFLLGAVLSSETAFRAQVQRQLSAFVTAFFLPIFFTYTGLRTHIQSLDSLELWLLFAVVLAAAIGGKWIGCAAAARWTGFSPRESMCFGILMNTRALMELVVINVGYDLGVIPSSVFCMLVLMALITTVMTTPMLLWAARGTELEPLIAQSEFRRGHRRPTDVDAQLEKPRA
jgi:Kef-type K+ transport system membrane component KefB